MTPPRAPASLAFVHGYENIAEALLARFERTPERVVLVADGTELRAGELAAAAREAGARLVGVRRVGLVGENTPWLVAELLGALAAEVAVAPLHAGTPPAECLRLATQFGLASIVGRDGPSETAVSPRGGAGAPDDPAALLLSTSGTTGLPRAVVVGHRALARHTTTLASLLELGPADRVLAMLPLAHSFGCRMALLAPLWAGATVVLLPRFSARESHAALTREAITWAPVVPTMLAAWNQLAPEPPPPALRWVLAAGAPLPEALRQAAERTLGVPVREGYGLTEATFAALDAPPEAPTPGSVGRPVPGVEIRLDAAAHEIQIRGQNLMQGYLDDPDATRAAFTADGWLRTGDVGRWDADGRLFLVDRIKDIILPGGYTVYPAEVEAALAAHPDVAAVAVVGRPDAFLGEAIVAYIVPRAATHEGLAGAPDADALRAFVAARLAPYKVPHVFAWATELPLGPTGKVLRQALRARAGAERQQGVRGAAEEGACGARAAKGS